MAKRTKKKTYSDSEYFKYICEGAKNFDEVIDALEFTLEHIRLLKSLKCKITDEVDNGHMNYSIPADSVEEFCKLHKCSLEDIDDERWEG